MNKIYIGKYTNTHGIKGEIKILSNFELKELVFKKDFKLYIKEQDFIIESYRPHQEYDMVTLVGINNINDIESLKGNAVYINRDDLNLNDNEYLLNDLVDMDIIFNNQIIGKVKEVLNNKNNILLKVNNFYIPKQEHFLKKVDLINKQIIVENVEGLMI